MIFAYLILLGFWLCPLLWGLQIWSQATLLQHRTWQDDHKQAFCGRLLALEENLASGMALWLEAAPRARGELEEVYSEARELWERAARRDGLDCESARGFEIYAQDNPELALSYPNWWVRWKAEALSPQRE